MWKLKDSIEELPAWIIEGLPTPPPQNQPALELPLPSGPGWSEPPRADDEPRGTGGTVIVIAL